MEVTDYAKQGTNKLEVWVTNAYNPEILPISGDFNIYGGIHRPCHLLVTEQDCISPLFYASPGVFIHQDKVSEKQAQITVETMLSLRGKKQGLKVRTTIEDASVLDIQVIVVCRPILRVILLHVCLPYYTNVRLNWLMKESVLTIAVVGCCMMVTEWAEDFTQMICLLHGN